MNTWETYAGLLRHFLTVVAGAVATNGLITDAQGETVVGAIVGLAGVVWSVVHKARAKRILAAAVAAPAGETGLAEAS